MLRISRMPDGRIAGECGVIPTVPSAAPGAAVAGVRRTRNPHRVAAVAVAARRILLRTSAAAAHRTSLGGAAHRISTAASARRM